MFEQKLFWGAKFIHPPNPSKYPSRGGGCIKEGRGVQNSFCGRVRNIYTPSPPPQKCLLAKMGEGGAVYNFSLDSHTARFGMCNSNCELHRTSQWHRAIWATEPKDRIPTFPWTNMTPWRFERARHREEKSVHGHHRKKIIWGAFRASKKNFPDRWWIQKTYKNQETIYLPPKSFLCGPPCFLAKKSSSLEQDGFPQHQQKRSVRFGRWSRDRSRMFWKRVCSVLGSVRRKILIWVHKKGSEKVLGKGSGEGFSEGDLEQGLPWSMNLLRKEFATELFMYLKELLLWLAAKNSLRNYLCNCNCCFCTMRNRGQCTNNFSWDFVMQLTL